MRLIRSIAFILLFAFIFSSCAIHKKFPFICFRKDCVKVQFGIYKLKAWKKNRQGKANMRRNKANSKAGLNKKKKGVAIDNGYNPNDTLGYAGGSTAATCNEVKVVFFNRSTNDTIIVGFQSNEIAELDQVQLNGYLYKNNTSDIIKVKLCDCASNNHETEYSKGSYLQHAAKVSTHLKSKGVPKRKIEFE